MESLIYRFGEFELEPSERRLSANGNPIALTPKVFDTLALLVESAGHAVKKDDLMKALWPRGYVDEAALSNHIWQIRRALGDTAKTARFIETVPKLGYRFVAPVSVIRATAPELPGLPPAPAAVSTAGPVPPERVSPGRASGLLGTAAAALALAAILFAGWRWLPHSRHPVPAADRSVALIGFTNLSQMSADAWLAPALMAMLGTELAAAPEIRVVPYTEVRDAVKSLEAPVAGGYARDALLQLRNRLHADYVVNGNYLVGTAAADPTLRIDISLQDTRTGALIASVSNQAGLLALNALVSEAGTALRAKLAVTPPNAEMLSSIAHAQPPTTEVARRMGLALDAMERYDAARARDELVEAVAQAPGYAPAYLYLAKAWSALGYRQKSLAAAEQALGRAENLPPEQRLLIDAAAESAGYQWGRAAATWKGLVALKPLSPEYRISWIDAQLAAGDATAALAALNDLRRMAPAAGDPRVELVAARIAAYRNDAKAAVSLAAEALRQSQLRNAPGLIAESEVELAKSQMRLGKTEEASEALAAAIVAYQGLGNPHGESEARRGLAEALGDLHRGKDARDEYQRAMALSQNIGDLGSVGAVYRDLCAMLWTAGDRDAAQAAAQQALRIGRETGDLRLQAWTLRALANVATDEAASDEALSEYREVTQLTERSNDPGGHVWSLATYADTLRMRGQLDEAQLDCRLAQSEAAALSDPQFRIFSQFNCALVTIDRGGGDAARDVLQNLAILAENSADPAYAANAHLVLGQLDYDAERWTQARDQLSRAVKGFSASELRTGEADAQAMLALCEQSLGDIDARNRAAERARTLRAAITSRQEIYLVDIALAQVAGETPDGDAIVQLRELAADAERRQFLSWSLEAKLAEWRLLRMKGDTPGVARLRNDLEATARRHGFGRIIKLLNAAPQRKTG